MLTKENLANQPNIRMMLNRFSRIAVSSCIALVSALVPAVFLPNTVSAAETEELKKCDPEPTNMTLNYGDGFTCISEEIGDSDIFRIEGTAGDKILFGVSSGGRRMVKVIDANGNTLDEARGRGVIFELTLEQTGIYTFVVSASEGFRGPYVVEVFCLGGSCLSRQN